LKWPSSPSSSAATQQKQQQLLRPHTFEPIPGLFVYEDFITEEEESMILHGIDVVDTLPWKISKFNGKHIGKRWGVHCNLRDRRVDAPENPLPDILQQIVLPKLKRLLFHNGKKNTTIPNEANSIDYRRKQGHWLQDHVDDRKLSKEVIFNLSLVGDCYMTFTNIAKHRNIAVPKQRVLLKRRCLQIITGKSRYDFTHGITNSDLLSDRRISITMRESPLTKSKPKPITTQQQLKNEDKNKNNT
jgi:alkylated DNA repair protein alkB family protein 4